MSQPKYLYKIINKINKNRQKKGCNTKLNKFKTYRVTEQ